MNLVSGDMSFDDVSAHQRCVARPCLRGNLVNVLDRLDVCDVLAGRSKALAAQMFDSICAATACGVFEDLNGNRFLCLDTAGGQRDDQREGSESECFAHE